MRTDGRKRGQAAVEAAIALGIFVFVTSALLLLARAAVVGLEEQGTVRADAGEQALNSDVRTYITSTRTQAVRRPTGEGTVKVGDTVVLPGMRLSTK